MANEKDFSIELKSDVAKGTYSNLAIITHSRSEFVLDFASMLPGLPTPEVHNRIIMNPEHAKRLFLALQDDLAMLALVFVDVVLEGEEESLCVLRIHDYPVVHFRLRKAR